MSIAELRVVWEVIKHGVPAAEAAWGALKPALALEQEDGKAAVAAIEKAFADAKAVIPVIEAAVKAAVQS
jgi:hypothetical protein